MQTELPQPQNILVTGDATLSMPARESTSCTLLAPASWRAMPSTGLCANVLKRCALHCQMLHSKAAKLDGLRRSCGCSANGTAIRGCMSKLCQYGNPCRLSTDKGIGRTRVTHSECGCPVLRGTCPGQCDLMRDQSFPTPACPKRARPRSKMGLFHHTCLAHRQLHVTLGGQCEATLSG